MEQRENANLCQDRAMSQQIWSIQFYRELQHLPRIPVVKTDSEMDVNLNKRIFQ